MKYTIDEFFEEEIPEHIQEQVDCEIMIIQNAITFGEWLGATYKPDVIMGEVFWSASNYTEPFTTSQLWQKFNEEL